MKHPGDRSVSPLARNILVLILLASFLLTYYTILQSGVFRVDDEHILASRAISLHLRGEITDPQVYGNQRVRDLYELDAAATEIEPGQAVIAQPFLWLASLLGIGTMQALFSMTAVLTAATAVVLGCSILAAGYSTSTALCSALLFGTATTAAAYADTFYRDSQAMFFGMLAFLGMLLWFRRGRLIGLLLFGGAALAAVLTKNNMLALIPAFAAGQLLALKKMRNLENWPRIRRILLAGAAVLFLAAAVVLILPERGALARFSRSYYLFLFEFFRESLTPEFLLRAAGPLVSPAKSILIFSPPLLLFVVGLSESWKTDRALTGAALVYAAGISTAQALFFREDWAGTFGWGLRFMLPVIPVCMMLGAGALERWQKHGWKRYLPWAFFAVGWLINFAGQVVSWRVPYRIWLDKGLNPFSAETVWQWRYLAIPHQAAGLVDLSDWSLTWLRAVSEGVSSAYLAPVFGLALLGGLAVVMYWLLKGRPLEYSSVVLLGILAGMGIMSPLLQGLWLSRVDPYWSGGMAYQQALAYVEEEAMEGDVVVFDSYGTDHWHCWLNDWEGKQVWYSLPYEISGPVQDHDNAVLTEPTRQLFESFIGVYERVLYVASSQAPDYLSGMERDWLTERFGEAGSEFFVGESEMTVSVFNLTGE